MPSPSRRRLPGLLAGPLAGAVTAVLLVPGAALAQDPSGAPATSPSAQPTLVPLPEPEPTREPGPEPDPEPGPERQPTSAATAAATTAPPSAAASRRPRRSASPRPVRTRDADEALPATLPTTLPIVTSGSPSPTLPSAPLEPDLRAGTPAPASEPAAASEPAEDPLTRILRLALGGAVLLGLAGVTGLYLTREPREHRRPDR